MALRKVDTEERRGMGVVLKQHVCPLGFGDLGGGGGEDSRAGGGGWFGGGFFRKSGPVAVGGDGRWYWCWGFFKVCLFILVEKWGIGFWMSCDVLIIGFCGIGGGGRGGEMKRG